MGKYRTMKIPVNRIRANVYGGRSEMRQTAQGFAP